MFSNARVQILIKIDYSNVHTFQHTGIFESTMCWSCETKNSQKCRNFFFIDESLCFAAIRKELIALKLQPLRIFSFTSYFFTLVCGRCHSLINNHTYAGVMYGY